MVRSPFFILLFLSLLSCKKESSGETLSDQNNEKAYLIQTKAKAYYENEKYDSALYCFEKAKYIYEIEKDTSNIGYCLTQIAEIQQTYGDYTGSEGTVTELLSYQYPFYDQYAYNLLGIVSKELENYDDAISYYTQAMNSTKNPAEKQSPRNNMAAVYIQQKNYEKAIPILNDILETRLLDVPKFQKRQARVTDNLGFAYSKDNQEKKGLDLMHQALAKRIEIEDSYGSIESYLHLAAYYQDIDFGKFKTNALEAYQTATLVNSIDERLEALQLLMSYPQEKGKNKYAIRFNTLNDSIRKVRNNVKNQFAKIKYDSRAAKEAQAQTQIKLERQINRGYYYIFGILSLLLAIAYVVNYFRNKNKRGRIEEAYKTETRISKQLHDELANDVFHTMTFAETQDLQNPERKEVLLDNLDKIYSRTRNISGENSAVDTGEQFEANLKDMLSSYKSDQVNIIIRDNKDIDWLKVEAGKKIAVHRILQELLVNMKKHSECNLTIIGFVQKEKQIEIQYSDNGKGCGAQINLKNGLRNVENRIQAIKGTITFDSEIGKGLKVNISFPK